MRLIPFIKTHKRILFCAVLATLLIAFVLLSCFVVLEPPEYLDIHISEEIQETQTRNLNILMIWISGLGENPYIDGYGGIKFVFFPDVTFKKEALLVLSTLLSGVLGLGLKILINRPRPPKDLVVLLEETKYQSFPSGHVLFYTVFFGTLILIILYFQKMKSPIKIVLTSICLLMIFLGAVSRVYLGAHWFTDVLGGFILGIFYVLITGYFYIKNERIFLKI